MPHHVLGDVDGDELFAVVHCKRVAYELGHNHGASAPSLDYPLPTSLIHLFDPPNQLVVNKGPFLK